MDAQTQTPISPVIKPVQRRDEPADQQAVVTPKPSDKTPEEFYAEITQRPDIRAILEELARG